MMDDINVLQESSKFSFGEHVTARTKSVKYVKCTQFVNQEPNLPL